MDNSKRHNGYHMVVEENVERERNADKKEESQLCIQPRVVNAHGSAMKCRRKGGQLAWVSNREYELILTRGKLRRRAFVNVYAGSMHGVIS